MTRSYLPDPPGAEDYDRGPIRDILQRSGLPDDREKQRELAEILENWWALIRMVREAPRQNSTQISEIYGELTKLGREMSEILSKCQRNARLGLLLEFYPRQEGEPYFLDEKEKLLRQILQIPLQIAEAAEKAATKLLPARMGRPAESAINHEFISRLIDLFVSSGYELNPKCITSRKVFMAALKRSFEAILVHTPKPLKVPHHSLVRVARSILRNKKSGNK